MNDAKRPSRFGQEREICSPFRSGQQARPAGQEFLGFEPEKAYLAFVLGRGGPAQSHEGELSRIFKIARCLGRF